MIYEILSPSAISLAESERLEWQTSGPYWSPSAQSSLEFLPAMRMTNRRGLSGMWSSEFERRVRELRQLPPGWDSYGADALTPRAATVMTYFLEAVDQYIQSTPQVSLTVDGGLLCEWESPGEGLLGLTATPKGRLEVYYYSVESGEEFEGSLPDFEDMGKLLWRTSASGHERRPD